MLKKLITVSVCFLFPNSLSFWILNLMGHQVNRKAKIGFSILWFSDTLTLDKFSRIGHLNIIKIDSLFIGESGYIGRFNKISGPIDIILEKTAAIGNGNSIDRAPIGVTYGKAILKLGILSKLTAHHRIDCTRSIIIGNYTTLAGHDSQIWTHAYYHDKQGPGRFRVDGEVAIGNNVYIGSRCIINGGVSIADAVVVGSNSAISKSLLKAGTYVNQALRFIETTDNTEVQPKLKKIEGHIICEPVYEKKKDA